MDAKSLERWAMSRKRIVRVTGDIREHPRYSVNEAAIYLDIPPSTLNRWIKDDGPKRRPLIQAADPKQSLLSFYNLVEAHILVSTRRRKISMPKVRVAVEYAQEMIGGKHPLATYKFATSGKSIFVEQLDGLTVDATKFGQPALGDILDRYLRGIRRDGIDKMPVEIRPLTLGTLRLSPVVINPFLSSGVPVIKGTGIVASTVWKRARGGEPIRDLALDYDLKLSEIQTIIKYFDEAA
jgi:uncharacterized protein (DUF433 family)